MLKEQKSGICRYCKGAKVVHVKGKDRVCPKCDGKGVSGYREK